MSCSEIAKSLRQWIHTQTSTAVDLPIAGDVDLTCTCVWIDAHNIYTGRHAHVQVSTVSKNGVVTVGKGSGVSRRGQSTPKTGASIPGPAAAASVFTPPADLRASRGDAMMRRMEKCIVHTCTHSTPPASLPRAELGNRPPKQRASTPRPCPHVTMR